MLQEDPQGSFNDTFGSWGMKILVFLIVQQRNVEKIKIPSFQYFFIWKGQNQQFSQMSQTRDIS